MQATHLVTLLAAMAFSLSAQVRVPDDPFAPESVERNAGTPEKEMAYRADSGFLIRSKRVLDPSELDSALWPKHEAPLAFNRRFDRPTHVWELRSGYFIAYEAGEWGGALFYLQKGTITPVRILEDYVSSIVEVAPHTYIVAGGLDQLERVHRLWIDKAQRWRHRQVLENDLEGPWFLENTAEGKGVIVGTCHWNEKTKTTENHVCGISASGAVHLYGICERVPVDDKSQR